MQTKTLMIGSAIMMLALGFLLTFAPQEVLTSGGSISQPASVLVVQAAGALYFGFALLNWMAKDNLIGGIYSRPVSVGNFLHFAIMAITMLKALAEGHRTAILLVVTFFYALLAAWFGLVVFGTSFKRERA